MSEDMRKSIEDAVEPLRRHAARGDHRDQVFNTVATVIQDAVMRAHDALLAKQHDKPKEKSK